MKEDIGVVIKADGVVETTNGLRLTATEVKKLGTALVDASRDSSSFASEADKAARATGTLGKQTADTAKSVGALAEAKTKLSGAAVLAGAAVGGFAATALVALGSKFVENIGLAIRSGAEIARMAEIYGLSAEKISTLKFGADLSDTNINAVGAGLERLAKNALAAAKGNGDAAVAFRTLGIEVKNADGSIRPLDELLYAAANGIKSIDDSATKSAVAMMIFGRAGADMVPFLNNGADGLKRLQQEGERWAQMSSMTAAEGKKLNDQMVEMDYATQVVAKSIGKVLVPELNSILQSLLEGTKAAGGFGRALLMFGSMNPFRSVGSSLASHKEELAGLINERDRARSKGEDTWSIDPKINNTQRKVTWLESEQRRLALGSETGNTTDSTDRLSARSAVVPAGTGATVAAKLEYDAIERANRPKSKRMAEELKKLEDAAKQSGNLDTPGYEETKAEIIRKFADKGSSPKSDKEASQYMSKLQQLEHQLGRAKKAGVEAELTYDTTEGTLKKLTVEQKAHLLVVAREVDQKNKLRETNQALLKSNEAEAIALEKINQAMRQVALTRAANHREAANRMKQERDDIGRPRAALERDKFVRDFDTDTRRQASELQIDGDDGLTVPGGGTAMLALIQERETALREQLKLYDEIKAKERDWLTGATSYFEAYIDSATNAAENTKRVFEVAFGGLENLLFESKGSWRDWGIAVLKEVAKVQFRMAMANQMKEGGLFGGLLGKLGGKGGTDATVVDDLSGPAGGSGLFSLLGGIFGSSHTGGIAGSESGPSRFVSAAMLASAPRYHAGGLAGDEVPTVLQRGEGVFTKGQMAALGAGIGGAGAQKVQVVVNNYADASATVSERTGADGARQVEITVRQAVRDELLQQRRNGGMLFGT